MEMEMEGDEVELEALRKRYSRQQLEEANVEEIRFGQLMAMEVLSQADVLSFQEKGFLVVSDVLTEPQCRILEQRVVETVNLSLFAAEDFKLAEGDTYSVLINSHDQQALLRNPHCTKKLLNDGKTRRPHVSKVHGHWNLYWLPEMQTIVNSNPKIYTVHRQLYGKYQLRSSLNTIGLKPPTSLDMPALAFDAPLYEEASQTNECLERSIKSVVCLRSPDDVEPRDSGTFELVESFHLYFELAAAFLNPSTGYPDCRLPAEDPLGRAIAHLDLPALNLYIRMYTFIQRFKLRPNTPVPSMTSTAHELSPFAATTSPSSWLSPSSASASSTIPAGDAIWAQHLEMWRHALLTYHGPEQRIEVPEVARQLRWTVVPLSAGSLLARDSRTPYRTLRNLSARSPFLYAYCTMSKITNEALYYGSDDWKTLGKCNRNVQGAHKDSKSFNELELELFEKHYHNGVYNHFRQDNLLSKALWGWDFRKLAMFKWSAYAEPGTELPKRAQGTATDVPSPDPLCGWESSPPPSGTVSTAPSLPSPLGAKRPRVDKPAKRLAKRTTLAKRSAKAKATAELAGSPLLFESQPSAGASEWRAVRGSPAGADLGGAQSFDHSYQARSTTTEDNTWGLLDRSDSGGAGEVVASALQEPRLTTTKPTAAASPAPSHPQLSPSLPRSPWKPMPLRPIVLAAPDDPLLLEGQQQPPPPHQHHHQQPPAQDSAAASTTSFFSAGCHHCAMGRHLDLRPRISANKESGDGEGEAVEVYAGGHAFSGAGRKQARVRMQESERELAELQESGGCAVEQSVVRYTDEEGRPRCRLVVCVRSLVTTLHQV